MVEWYAERPCEQVVRGLYVTEEGDARALVSVVLVTMPDESLAQQLKAVTDTDGTGNVNDLVRDGTASLPRAPVMIPGQYHSEVEGREVTIVETDFFDEHTDPDLLHDISVDAARSPITCVTGKADREAGESPTGLQLAVSSLPGRGGTAG